MKLSTVEKFLLIAHHPSKSNFAIPSINLHYGIIGAILLQLSFEKRISVEDNKLVIKTNLSHENEMITGIENVIRNAKKTQKLKSWIVKLTRRSSDYKWIVMEALAAKNIVRFETKRFFGLISYRRSFLLDTHLQNELIQQLKNNILFRKEMDVENTVILGLIEACKMHKIFANNREELRTLKKALKEMIKHNEIASIVDQTIQQIQAAIIGAVVASSVTPGR